MAQHSFQYRSFTILKDQTLGHGSYGAVYKAKCDQLMCAAKVLHPTIVDSYDPGSEKILQRFQQECDFLNQIRHPHIVQYLGVCRDPDSNLPALLMELLDDSLTTMLEHSPHPISYHIQVDLCHHIALAIAYLHSNGIIHRDLSGNNVLVIAGRRAKVTDFGMSRIIGTQRHLTPLTLCPGTLGYMSPESLIEPPRYTEKLDVFSQGVIMIQVCTQQFPDPGPAMKQVEDVRSPTGMIQIPLLEPERRKKHINLIHPTHPLLPIALACLEYRERDRPSAEELCQRLADLKENQEFIESSQKILPVTPEVNGTQNQERDELARQVEEKSHQLEAKDQLIAMKDEELTAKDEQLTLHSQQTAAKDQQIAMKDQEIAAKNQLIAMKDEELTAKNEQLTLHSQQTAAKDQQIAMKDREIAAKNQELTTKDRITTQQIRLKNGEVERLGPQLKELYQRLVENEKVTAQFQEVNQQLQRQNQNLHQQVETLQWRLKRVSEPSKDIVLQWRYGGKAPFNGIRGSSVVVGNVTYFSSGSNVYLFNRSSGKWNNLPGCPQRWGSPAIIKGLLTMVGGRTSDSKTTNKLLSLTDCGKWMEQFSPMPTARTHTTATTYQTHLIVAGGSSTGLTRDNMDKVELLNTHTLVWSTATSLPHPVGFGSATIVSDCLYMLGGNDRNGRCRSVFSCSLPDLLQSCQPYSKLIGSKVWQHDADIPVYWSTCATVHGQLASVGGMDESDKVTSAVYKYDPNTRSWSIISHMPTARRQCYVAVVENTKELMVVGGRTSISLWSDADCIEMADY